MKILFVQGTEFSHDYAASMFETQYAGQSVESIIKRVQSGEKFMVEPEEGDDEECEFTLSIVDVPDIVISKEFVQFIKNDLLDYDGGKHANFYMPNTKIPE